MALAIGQDYLFSRIYGTGFYLAESALYQSIWLFFLPLVLLQRSVIFSARLPRWAAVAFALPLAALHLTAFAGWFTMVSAMVFTPAHRFLSLLGSASAGQLVVVIGVYVYFACLPLARRPVTERAVFVLRSGSRTVRLDCNEIVSVESDKPYTAVTTLSDRYLDDRPLRIIEGELPSGAFLRVHRGCIVRDTAVRRLDARGNGDYDALLVDGRRVRLSRHRRVVWEHLLRSEGAALQ